MKRQTLTRQILNRRRFLSRATLIVSANLLPLPGYATGPYGPLLETISDPMEARRIGVTFLEQSDLGHDAAAVHRIISEKFGPLALLQDRQPEDCKALIAAQVQRDFDSGDCVKVDGWVLSKTEAMLFALAALHV